jgi:S-adenosylmethionine:tRNA ribosyltransferase-isomerase
VFRARLRGRKPTGGAVEFLFVRSVADGGWQALCQGSRGLKEGTLVEFPGATARVAARGRGAVVLQFPAGFDVAGLLEGHGEVPLPPYIRRGPGESCRSEDRSRYQTVFARRRGAVAAPTAGLHFTDELLARLAQRGIGHAFVTLHVGPGTFLPVRAADAREHRIHSEPFVLPAETSAAVDRVRRSGRRVVAVGTTVARVLEHTALQGKKGVTEGECDLYVLPGHEFRRIDALITNFHLPRSTLLLFVAAFAGREPILSAYREAVRQRYRFYSYGDAMLIT